jgi:23S rRNA (cytidine2498-2'-O)-methyltransferase
MSDPQFLFVCCQFGAEPALKSEVERTWPGLRFAFSRPGFVTFKHTGDKPLSKSIDLRSVFARTYGFSIGEIKGDDPNGMARVACQLATGEHFQQLHVWPRDTAEPGHRGFVPGATEDSNKIAEIIQREAVANGLISDKVRVNGIAQTDQRILDLIVIDENHWWLGRHTASSRVLRQPGGIFKGSLPEDAVSRAYLKMNEALAWSQLPVEEGDRIVEIGSAPGGASQALLERGLHVTGVDPSDMHEKILAHPNFTHVKKRGADPKRREYASFPWLAIDSNVAPSQTLDTVQNIVVHDSSQVRGMLLTLKLPEWQLTDEIPSYVERIRSWGFSDVRARQLANNRQEVCVAVLKSKSERRLSKSKRKHLAIKKQRRTAKPRTSAQQTPEPQTSEPQSSEPRQYGPLPAAKPDQQA